MTSVTTRPEVRLIAAADVGPAAAHVTDPRRERPVLLVSVSSDTGEPRVPQQLLVDALGGDVDLMVFTDMAAAVAWSDLVDDDLRAYGGAIRLVNGLDDPDPGGVFLTYPGTDPTLTVSRIRRRLVQPHRAPVKASPVRVPAGLPVVRAVTPPLRPTPNMLRRGPHPVPPPAAPPPAVTPPVVPMTVAAPPVAAVVAPPVPTVVPAPSEPAGLRAEVAALRDEVRRLREREQTAERELFQAWDELATRDELIQSMTDAGNDGADEVYERVVFADPERQFRHVLALRMVMNLAEADRPLAQLERLRIGPRWLEDLGRLSGVSRLKLVKVLDTVLDVLGGRAWERNGRDVHQQRTGPGGEDPVLLRTSDGAVAWRASLQHKTPQARRLLWWAVPGDVVELSRVAAHDDYAMP